MNSGIPAVPEAHSEPIPPRDPAAPVVEALADVEKISYMEVISDSELKGFGLPDPICLTGRRNAMDQYMTTVPADLLIQFMSLSDDVPISQASDSTMKGSTMDMDRDLKYDAWSAAAYYQYRFPKDPWGDGPLEIFLGKLVPLTDVDG